MIRPITVLTFVLACGSGMYLYQAKHRVHLLDQQIDEAVHQTEALRGQSRALHAEWMLLNDPDRLHRLAARYLAGLQPVAPTQFTDLTDLDSRLPPVGLPPADTTDATVASADAPPAPGGAAIAGESADRPASAGVSGSGPNAETDRTSAFNAGPGRAGASVAAAQSQTPVAEPSLRDDAAAAVATETRPADQRLEPATADAPPEGRGPRPVIAQTRPAVHSPQPVATQLPSAVRATRAAIAEAPPADRAPRPMMAQTRHPVPRVYEPSPVRPQSVAAARTPPRVPVWRPAPPRALIADAAPPRFVTAEQRPMPAMRRQAPSQTSYGGSMLGMARGGASVPRPVPLNAAYNASNSGG